MNETTTRRMISPELIRLYLVHLREQERAAQTIQKYARDLASCSTFLL